MSVDYENDYDEEEQADLNAELEEGYAEIEQKFAVDTQKGFENVIVVDNIPIVDEAKRQRLVDRLRQVFEKAGASIDEDSVTMPWDDAAATNKGFVFLTYPDAQQAENALRALDGLAFGKAHTLYVNRFGDIERYANLPLGEGELPAGWKEKPFVERDYLRSWLGDASGRDQYLTFRDQDVNLWWNGRNGVQEAVKGSNGKPIKNSKWAELYLSWSPRGTYLASLHRVGVALWCGPQLDGPIGVNVFRFTHPGVRLLQFSPCENYLVTWSEEPLENIENHPNPSVREVFGPEDEGNQIVVWDIKTSKPLRTFPADKPQGPDERPRTWPYLKWSPDDAYIARCTPGSAIAVYELPSMGLLEKKSIKIDGVQDFEWRPMSEKDFELKKAGKGKENMLVYWTPEVTNQPAKVNLMAVPSRTVLRSKNLFNVTDCKFYWQNQGDYLCVKVDRHARKAKSKKATFCNLELFRVREKDYPVEVIEHKDYVPSFAWEPMGTRFAIVSTNDPNYTGGPPAPGVVIKYNIDFYQLDPKKGDFAPIKHLEGKIANTLLWAPKGRHIVLATIGSSTRFDIEFWDLDFTTDDNPRKETAEPGANVQLMATGEHYGISELAWDPSGRYLATSASAWRQSPEPGYAVWDFKGTQLSSQNLEKFKQFLWRPRPPTLLSKDAQRKVRKELKDHSRLFDEEDAAEENRGSAEKLAQRQRDIAEWNAWRARNVARLADERTRRGVVLYKDQQGEAGGAEADEKVEEWIEELVDEVEEVVVA